jgi:hypothetical protein
MEKLPSQHTGETIDGMNGIYRKVQYEIERRDSRRDAVL